MKGLLGAILQEGKTRWLQSRYDRPVIAEFDRPLVSLTFDDVPMSAYEYGLPIMEQLGTKATFYVSLGIKSETNDPAEKFVGPEEVKHLLALGHEIGCHTFSHYRLSNGSATKQYEDAQKNVLELENIIGKGEIQSFSFPYGELSLRSKRLFQNRYNSLRSSRPGINYGKVDLNCLKAISMGKNFMLSQDFGRWLERLKLLGGWAIFYTHGVKKSPGQYDITPQDLFTFAETCRKMNIEIAPVSKISADLTNR